MVKQKDGPWRHPAEATEDYPGLWVHDGVQSGSITFGQTRLPIWSPQWQVVDLGDYVQPDDPETEWRDTAETFVSHLLGQRGEFARLLLAIANAERAEQERDEIETEQHFAKAHPDSVFCDCMFRLPSAWWDDPDLSAPVLEALRRCLAVLGAKR